MSEKRESTTDQSKIAELRRIGFEVLPGETWPDRPVRFFTPFDVHTNETTGDKWQLGAINLIKDKARRVQLPSDFKEAFPGHKMLARYITAFTHFFMRECAVIFTPTEIRILAGSAHGVDIPSPLDRDVLLLTHTHPSGGPFSEQDIDFAFHAGINGLEVIMIYEETPSVIRLAKETIAEAKKFYRAVYYSLYRAVLQEPWDADTKKHSHYWAALEFLARLRAEVYGKTTYEIATKKRNMEWVSRKAAEIVAETVKSVEGR